VRHADNDAEHRSRTAMEDNHLSPCSPLVAAVESVTIERFVVALTLCGLTAPMVLGGPMNGPTFLAYVEQVLVPTLKRGMIVVMDNLIE